MSLAPRDAGTRSLLAVGRLLTRTREERVVLERVLDAGREITGARYAALGVLNERRTELARFLTSGVEEAAHSAIGIMPRGRGVLGTLIEHPQPLRLGEVGEHATSYGFPAGHPEMHTFLGVPLLIRGEVSGNLYLAEKDDGEFTAGDEEAVVILAERASTAIENARR